MTQTGRSNYLASLAQTGAGNSATLTLQGDGNGSGGVAFASAAALSVGIGQAIITQSGGDTVSYGAYGNSNLYGFVQLTGIGNSIIGTSTGNSNEVAIKQNGGGNITDFTQLGNGNVIGVSLLGDNNGALAFGPGAAGDLSALNPSKLTEGSIYQDSSLASPGNAVTYTVNGSNNRFAFAQIGGGNTINGSVGGVASSSNNQIAVLQVGSNNTANFTQTGTGSNNASISQWPSRLVHAPAYPSPSTSTHSIQGETR